MLGRLQKSVPLSAAATPEDAVDGLLEALSRLDPDAMVTFCSPEVTLFYPTQPHRLIGRGAFRDAFAGFTNRIRAGGATALELAREDVLVQRLGDAAVISFHLTKPFFGRRTFVLQRGDDGWQIVHVHASNMTLPS